MSRTVKVRIAAAVDERGQWFAVGWSPAPDRTVAETESSAMEDAALNVDPDPARYWLEAELPVPEPVTVQATVSEAG